MNSESGAARDISRLLRNETGLRGLLSRLVEADVKWAFARRPERIAKDLAGEGELDIWAATSAAPRVLFILLELGYIPQSSVSVTAKNQSTSVVRFVHGESSSKRVVEFHFGTYFAAFQPFAPEATLASGIKTLGGYPFLSDLSLCLVDSVRLALLGRLDTHTVLEARFRVGELGSADFLEWNRLAQIALGPLVGSFLNVLSGKRKLNRMSISAFRLRSIMGYLRTPSAIRQKLARRFPEIMLTTHRTSVVAVLGVDGAGKTTTIARTLDRLEGAFFPVESVYAGRTRGNLHFTNVLRQQAFRLLRHSEPSRTNDDEHQHSDNDLGKARRILALFSLFVYAFDYRARLMRSMAWGIISGGVVLLDRGPDDLITVPAPNWMRKIALFIAPRSHMIALCHAPAETIFRRKPERSQEEIARRNSLYLRYLHESEKSKFSLILDTSQSGGVPARNLAFAICALHGRRRGLIDAITFEKLRESLRGVTT